MSMNGSMIAAADRKANAANGGKGGQIDTFSSVIRSMRDNNTVYAVVTPVPVSADVQNKSV